ncbi:MAG: hypothetical protein PVJ57_09845 [Phycisphaerae bacterium]|jgi:hypothetical protein
MLLCNVSRSGLAVLVTVCLGALLALGQAEGQATTQEAAPPTFVERLQARVEPLEVEGVLEIKAHFSRPLLTWRVNFDEENASRLVAEHVTSAPADPAARWYAWYCDLNEKLLAITEDEALKASELVFLNTDVSTDFSRGSLKDHSFTQVCVFRGSRCTYVDRVPAGVELTLPLLCVEEPPDVRVTVTIQPEKTTWRAREEIRGSIIWKNTGTQRVALRPYELPRARVRREDGTPPPTVDAKVFICPGSWAVSSPVVLMPGKRTETLFSIETDPLSAGVAILLDDGSYDLYVPDMEERLSIPTECPPVRIEVRTEPDQDLSPRITSFDAGGSRLVVVRENGDFEVYDIDSGQRAGGGHIASDSPVSCWESQSHVSPDGRWLALLHRTYGGPRATDIELYALDGESTSPRLLSLPLYTCYGDEPWLKGFGADGTWLCGSTGSTVWAVKLATEEVMWEATLSGDECVTRDGQRRAKLTEKTIEFSPRNSTVASAVYPLDEAGNRRFAFVGYTGVYVENGKTGTISYFSSDGQRQVTFGDDAKGVVTEAPDGTMVIVRERKTGASWDDTSLAVWQLDPPELLWRRASGDFRTVAFGGPPARVICASGNDDHRTMCTLAPTFEVYDAKSGELLRTIETPYRAP